MMERYVVVPHKWERWLRLSPLKTFFYRSMLAAKRTGISYPLKFPTILYVGYTVCSIYSMWYLYMCMCVYVISFYKYKNSYNEGYQFCR